MTNSWDDEPEEQKVREIGLLGMFQVDLDNMDTIEFAFMYHMQIPPTELGKWPYYYYEDKIEKLSDVLKKKEAAEKGQQQSTSFDPQREASRFMKNVPKMQTPSVKIPNFKTR